MQLNKREVIILRGVPGSGKSTVAKMLVEKGYYRVNKDDLRQMINNYNLNPDDERLIDSIQSDIIRTLIYQGKNIVVDNTHAKQKYVKQVVELAIECCELMPEFDYDIGVQLLDTSLEESIRRNNLREKPVPEDVIRKMHKQIYD
jgi:predicted kinase